VSALPKHSSSDSHEPVGQVIAARPLPAKEPITRGRRHRRSWVRSGRAHLELRGLSGPFAKAVVVEALRELDEMDGVYWSTFDAGPRRVIVAFDPATTSLTSLVEAVERGELACNVAAEPFPIDRADHPGDIEPLRRHVAAIGADVAGLGFAVVGRALTATPLPVELASLFSFVDNQPRLRHGLEAVVGPPATDLLLALGNAATQGLAQGPLGLVTDIASRVNLVMELLARRASFEAAEELRFDTPPSELTRPGSPLAVPIPDAKGRPVPPGPIERYADKALVATAVGAAAAFAGTGSVRRAAATVVASTPKAARMGREAFCSHLSRALIARDMLVLDSGALRRLDRVDSVVVDGALVSTGRSFIVSVELLDDDVPPTVVHRRLAQLFDPCELDTSRVDGEWELGQLSASERRRAGVRRARQSLGAWRCIALRQRGSLVAIAAVDDEISAAATHLIASARRLGLMVALAGGDRTLAERVGADTHIPFTGSAVEELRQDGCVVSVVAGGGPEGAPLLRAGDVSVEIAAMDGSSWAGHVVAETLADASFVLEAIGDARKVSRQSIIASTGGSALGGLLAVTGSRGTAAARAATAVNVTALAGIANGIRAAVHANGRQAVIPTQPVDWHAMEVNQAMRRTGSRPSGLSESEAANRRRSTTREVPPEPSLARSVAAELVNPLTPVLLGGAAASAAVGSITDASMVAGVSALNAVIGGVQRFRAERAISSLDESSAHPVTVIRPEGSFRVAAEDLVVGDVVTLVAGDNVPADCRLIESRQLEMDQSALTGESELVSKDPSPVFASIVAERTSMLYEGTTVAVGRATAMVVALGADTLSAAMAASTADATVAEGVEGRLRHLTSVTMPVSLAGGGIMVASGLFRRLPMNETVSSAVALAVAAVPEGLPLLATMAQLASARRLSARGALVRNPRAIEALGRVKVLCTDKTGTLTEGRIVLSAVSDGAEEFGLDRLSGPQREILAAGLRASPTRRANGQRLAHLTDHAVVEGARMAGIEVTVGAPGWKRVGSLPFEPGRAYHATLGRSQENLVLSVKGAPETVLPKCARWASPSGEVVAMGPQARRAIDRTVTTLASRGMRVLAVAERRCQDSPDVKTGDTRHPVSESDVEDLVFFGLLLLSDPVRPSAAQAVAGLRRAGVDVVMVTGDHPATARGIAEQLGIANGRRTLTGTELASLSDAGLDEAIGSVSVFARVTPADKVRIVRSLQRNGTAVAMTGDGANDAPAIRMAEVGIALGARSTPAAHN
jgi:cation-transporting ATPase I